MKLELSVKEQRLIAIARRLPSGDIDRLIGTAKIWLEATKRAAK